MYIYKKYTGIHIYRYTHIHVYMYIKPEMVVFKQYDFRNTTSVIETTEERAKLENWIPGGAARWVRLSYEAMKGRPDFNFGSGICNFYPFVPTSEILYQHSLFRSWFTIGLSFLIPSSRQPANQTMNSWYLQNRKV